MVNAQLIYQTWKENRESVVVSDLTSRGYEVRQCIGQPYDMIATRGDDIWYVVVKSVAVFPSNPDREKQGGYAIDETTTQRYDIVDSRREADPLCTLVAVVVKFGKLVKYHDARDFDRLINP